LRPQIWLTPPLLLYLTERIVRWMWPSVRSADLVDVQLLPGKENVICLRVRKPISFHYSCVSRTRNPASITLVTHARPPPTCHAL
jgi:hypothetical protein